MIKRLSLMAGLVALAAAFVLPLPVAAANPYQVSVKIDACHNSGGAHGRGYVELETKAREVGKSGTTLFVVTSELQESSGLGFGTQSTYPKETSMTFPNDSTSYFHVTDRRYDFTKNDELATRLQITVKFKDHNGHVLATRTVNGSPC